MKKAIEFKVNGKTRQVFVDPWRVLGEVLREEMGLMGLKIACGTGECGACTILLDGKPVRSCLLLPMQVRGREILTIEGLAKEDRLHPIQEAFIDYYAVQCGFCTPGMILTAKALIDDKPDPTEDDVREALVGNLCRCTGYVKIVDAVLAASKAVKDSKQDDGH